MSMRPLPEHAFATGSRDINRAAVFEDDPYIMPGVCGMGSHFASRALSRKVRHIGRVSSCIIQLIILHVK
jgi:hypothetical protein